jgi:glycosyltransferase involved in cell wall biosynthesis
MNKHTCVVSCPIDSISGYGSRARDFVKALIKVKGEEWDIKLLSMPWGATPFGALNEEDPEELDLITRIIPNNQLTYQPDIWFQITIPSEFQPVGKYYNVGLTAGIETDMCDASWIEGCNRMNLVLVSSKFAKNGFENTVYEKYDQHTRQKVGDLKLETKIEVLFEGLDLNKYKFLESSTFDLSEIKEEFLFLSVGHWLQGVEGEDRKDMGTLVRVFLETFKNKKNKPALLLKTQGATASLPDRNVILEKIDSIRKTVKGDLPNIYLLHGELTDEQMNEIYNHPKVKAFVLFSKGEGFGRPYMEFTQSKKPVIASAYSGHVDFLDPEFSVLVEGQLTEIHPSAVVKNMLIEGSKWFSVDPVEASMALTDVYENYKVYEEKGKRLGYKIKTNFSFEQMAELLGKYLNENVPSIPKKMELKLPQLKKIELPKLNLAESK